MICCESKSFFKPKSVFGAWSLSPEGIEPMSAEEIELKSWVLNWDQNFWVLRYSNFWAPLRSDAKNGFSIGGTGLYGAVVFSLVLWKQKTFGKTMWMLNWFSNGCTGLQFLRLWRTLWIWRICLVLLSVQGCSSLLTHKMWMQTRGSVLSVLGWLLLNAPKNG